jgi:hypothetical protein
MELADGLTDGRRFRCGACGNLTRFDVELVERVRRFWHVDLAGKGRVEDSDSLERTVLSVTCRWCSSADAIEVVDALTAEARPAGGDPAAGGGVRR